MRRRIRPAGDPWNCFWSRGATIIDKCTTGIATLAAICAIFAPATAATERSTAFGTLESGGAPSVAIRIAADAGPTVRLASRELKRYVAEMCGAELTIQEGTTPSHANEIVLLSARKGRSGTLVDGQPDAFFIRTKAGHLTISGATERATLYGVYTLLQRLGCRWLGPGEDYVPRVRKLTIPALSIDERPALRWRALELIAGSTQSIVDWMAKVRLNVAWPETYAPNGDLQPSLPSMRDAAVPAMVERGMTIFWGGHVLPTLFPIERYKEHPEYFAQIDGKRLNPQVSFQDRSQLCTSNSAVIRILAANTVQFLRDHPWIDVLFLWGDDTTRWCECPECRKLEPAPNSPSPYGGMNRSATYCRMVRLVSDEVRRALPGRRIGFNHYYNLEDVPRDASGHVLSAVMPRPGSTISAVDVYHQCDRHAFTDPACPKSKRIAPVAEMWGPYYPDTVSWSYYWSWNFMKGLPISMVHKIPADFRFVRSLGVNGVIDNVSLAPGTLQWYSNTLNMTLFAHASWNPDLNAAAVTTDYIQHLYGAAALPMARFWQLMDHCTTRYGIDPDCAPDAAAQRTQESLHGWMVDIRSLIPNRTMFDKAMGLLRAAAVRAAPAPGKTPTPTQRSLAFRIQLLRDVVERWQPPTRDYRVYGFLNGGGAGVNHIYSGDSVRGTVRCSVTGGNNHADCFWPTPLGTTQLTKAGDAVQVLARVNYGADVVGETVYRSGPGLYQAADQDAPCAGPGTRSATLFIANMDDDRSGPRRVILTIHDGGYATTVRSSADNAWTYGQAIGLKIEYLGATASGETYRYLYGSDEHWTEIARITFRGTLPYAAPMHYWAGLDYGRTARFPLVDWAEFSNFACLRSPQSSTYPVGTH